jgi:hypothetical protein
VPLVAVRVREGLVVSVYAVEPAGRGLVAVWPAAVGHQASAVAVLPSTVSEVQAGALSAALTRLSEAVWDAYVRPASATGDEQERSRREYEREQFSDVVTAVRKPSLPDESGMVIVSYSPVEESAHRLGRVLHEIADAALTDALVAEVQVELDAVTRAELGDLSGRAVQAVALDRLDASPVQVAAADAMLRADPLAPGLLSAAVEPAAACVAAAHWLAAAADVAAEKAGNTPAGVFAEADDIQAVSVQVPSLVVEAITEQHAAPRDVVLGLLREAVAAADGAIADLPAVVADRVALEDLLEELPAAERDRALAAEPPRNTPLDPRRPARDLLEHLLDGLNSCHVLYAEYALGEADVAGFGDDDGEPDDDLDTDKLADERYARHRNEIAETFAQLTRNAAAAAHQRLN